MLRSEDQIVYFEDVYIEKTERDWIISVRRSKNSKKEQKKFVKWRFILVLAGVLGLAAVISAAYVLMRSTESAGNRDLLIEVKNLGEFTTKDGNATFSFKKVLGGQLVLYQKNSNNNEETRIHCYHKFYRDDEKLCFPGHGCWEFEETVDEEFIKALTTAVFTKINMNNLKEVVTDDGTKFSLEVTPKKEAYLWYEDKEGQLHGLLKKSDLVRPDNPFEVMDDAYQTIQFPSHVLKFSTENGEKLADTLRKNGFREYFSLGGKMLYRRLWHKYERNFVLHLTENKFSITEMKKQGQNQCTSYNVVDATKKSSPKTKNGKSIYKISNMQSQKKGESKMVNRRIEILQKDAWKLNRAIPKNN